MADLRVLVAPQEFKGTLTAVEAAEAVRRGLSAAHPSWRFDLLPMADGGPGTTDALLAALGGERRVAAALDPWLRPIEAAWGLVPGNRGVVECAAATGLLRMAPEELTPAGVGRASSYGTGQLIAAALDAGVDELIVGLGGSATNDGGAGMAQALGFVFLDATGQVLGPGGAALRYFCLL
jgi:glycerate kinase